MRDTQFLKEVGGKVRSIRKAKGITLTKLAEMCNVNEPHLSRFESGQKDARILSLKNIADKLEIPVSDLF